MRMYRKNKFETLNEWMEATEPTLPYSLTLLKYSKRVGVHTISFTAADLFTARFGERYIAEPCHDDGEIPGFLSRLTVETSAVYAHMAGLIEGVDKMLDDLYNDSESETIGETTENSRTINERAQNKRAPLGDTSFTDAFSDGGVVRDSTDGDEGSRDVEREKTGANSGNIDRIIKAETDLISMWDKLMDRLEYLFIPVRSEWGCEVE